MKKYNWILSLIALFILIFLRTELSHHFVTLNRFWGFLGLLGSILLFFHYENREFRRGLLVTAVILLILFDILPLPYQWLVRSHVYFSLNLIATSLTIAAYCAFALYIAQLFILKIQKKRLHP